MRSYLKMILQIALLIFVAAVNQHPAVLAAPIRARHARELQSKGIWSAATNNKLDPCNPQTPTTLSAFQKLLPSDLAKHAGTQHLQTLAGVGKLSALSAAAATGNPVAITALAMFLASYESPLPGIAGMGNTLISYVNPAKLFSKNKPPPPAPKKPWWYYSFGKQEPVQPPKKSWFGKPPPPPPPKKGYFDFFSNPQPPPGPPPKKPWLFGKPKPPPPPPPKKAWYDFRQREPQQQASRRQRRHRF